MGSAIPRYRGRLTAAVSPSGKGTLMRGGSNVTTLKAGRYDVAVRDADGHSGFFVRRGNGKTVTVTSPRFVGSRTKRLLLTAGTWTFFTNVGSPATFRVVA